MKQITLLLLISCFFFFAKGQTIEITVDISELNREGKKLYLGIDGTLRPMPEEADTMMFKTSHIPNLMHLASIEDSRLNRHKIIYVKDKQIKVSGTIPTNNIQIIPSYSHQTIADQILDIKQPNLKTEMELALTEPYLIHLLSRKESIENKYFEAMVSNASGDILDFWAFKKIRTYLGTQEAVGYNEKSKVFSHFRALDPSKKVVEVRPSANKYLLLDFSTSGCGYCIIDIDKLVKIQETFHDKMDIVSLWHDPSFDIWINSSKKEKDKISWTNLMDESGGIFKAFKIRAYPTYLLIDPSGNVVKKWLGGLSKDKLEKYLDDRS